MRSHLVEHNGEFVFDAFEMKNMNVLVFLFVRPAYASCIPTNLSNCVSGRIEVCHFATPAHAAFVRESGATRPIGDTPDLAMAARVLPHATQRRQIDVNDETNPRFRRRPQTTSGVQKIVACTPFGI